jgi:inorganic triphosphatase YgiF
VLDKLRKKVARGGNNLIDLDDETRHELRITAKKLRYAAEFFGSLYQSKAETKRHKRLHRGDGGPPGSTRQPAPLQPLSELDLSNVAGAEDLVSAADKDKLLHDAAEAHDIFVDAKRFWR